MASLAAFASDSDSDSDASSGSEHGMGMEGKVVKGGKKSEALEFEDPYEDLEEESEEEAEEVVSRKTKKASSKKAATAGGAGGGADASDDEDDEEEELEEEDEDDEEEQLVKEVFRLDIDSLKEGEKLEGDMGAYVMYHAMAVEWPCLSFDIVPDRHGMGRTKFPLSATLVAGTQADKASNNRLIVMKAFQMHKTQERDEDEDSEDDEEERTGRKKAASSGKKGGAGGMAEEGSDSDSDEEDDYQDPELEVQRINHPGAVNRVRVSS